MKQSIPIGSITLNGKEISFQNIIFGEIRGTTSFEQDVLNFCQEWLKETALINFSSSGSTGKPKVIQVKREQVLASVHMTSKALKLNPDDKALLCIPVAGTGGKMMIARALSLNLKLECVEPSGNPFTVINNTPDFVALVPLQLHKIISDATTFRQLKKVRNIIVGGGPVDEELSKQLEQLSAPVYLTYGMTETVSHIALKLLNTSGKQKYFEVLPEIEISTDERECICIKGTVTDNKWIQTNDRIILIDKNHFEWLGRHDLVINSGGYKIQPEQLEDHLKKIMDSVEITNPFFVSGMPHKELGQQCTLFIEGKPIATEKLDLLNSLISNKLHPYERPKKIIFIPEFAQTASGKVDRRKTAEAVLKL